VSRREFIALVGGALAWPLDARAQHSTPPVIGFMSSRSPEDSQSVLAAFRKGLSESGLREDENVVIQFRWADGAFERLPTLAAKLVNDRVAVIVAAGSEVSASAAKAATSTIPILFVSTDPVKAGLVASLNRLVETPQAFTSSPPSWGRNGSACCTNFSPVRARLPSCSIRSSRRLPNKRWSWRPRQAVSVSRSLS
jgi:hypothetical protein